MSELTGRELDATVAVKVLGWKLNGPWGRRCEWVGVSPDGTRAGVPYYSDNIAAAWEVVEKFEALEYGKVRLAGSHYHGWYCSICWGPGRDGEGEAYSVFGATAPEAICRAAIAALRTPPDFPVLRDATAGATG